MVCEEVIFRTGLGCACIVFLCEGLLSGCGSMLLVEILKVMCLGLVCCTCIYFYCLGFIGYFEFKSFSMVRCSTR